MYGLKPVPFKTSTYSEIPLTRAVHGGCPLRGKAADGLALLDHLHHRKAFFRERSGGTGLHALAAAGAVACMAPVVLEVADDARVDAARGYLPDVRALHLRTDPDAAGAEDAAILVENEAGVGHVHGEARIVVGVAHVGDAQLAGHELEFAMAVGDAGRADVVALDQQQLDGHFSV